MRHLSLSVSPSLLSLFFCHFNLFNLLPQISYLLFPSPLSSLNTPISSLQTSNLTLSSFHSPVSTSLSLLTIPVPLNKTKTTLIDPEGWSRNEGKYLGGYSSGVAKYDTLGEAVGECADRKGSFTRLQLCINFVSILSSICKTY